MMFGEATIYWRKKIISRLQASCLPKQLEEKVKIVNSDIASCQPIMNHHGTDSLASLVCYRTFIRAISGGAAGSFSISLLYPLETIRTRLQVDDKRETRSTLQCLADIIRQEGPVALFRGWWSLVVSLWVTNFVYFYVFHSLRLFFISVDDADQAILIDLLFGIIAGAAATILSNPLWVVNTRLKLQGVQLNGTSDRRNAPLTAGNGVTDAVQRILLNLSLQHPSCHLVVAYVHPAVNNMNSVRMDCIDCLVNIVKHEGPLVLWSGLLSSLVLVVNPAINFMVYEALKRNSSLAFVHYGVNESMMFFTYGAASKFTATVITYPLQLIQTRARAGIAIPTLHQWSIWSRILFMYRGMESKLIQTVLNSALMLMAYERIETLMLLMFGLTQDDDCS